MKFITYRKFWGLGTRPLLSVLTAFSHWHVVCVALGYSGQWYKSKQREVCWLRKNTLCVKEERK